MNAFSVDRKVIAGGISGAVATVLFAVLEAFKVQVSPEVAIAVVTIVNFVLQWATPNKPVVPTQGV